MSTALKMPSPIPKMKKKNVNEILEELLTNQDIILEAVKNLNERIEVIENKVDDDKLSDLKDIIETQAVIDEVVVKSSDDIALMQKVKNENSRAIRMLESKIETLDKEIQKKLKELPQNEEKIDKEEPTKNEEIKKICKFYNKGYCSYKKRCRYVHPKNVCEIFLRDGKCLKSCCFYRHPRTCKYYGRGCRQSGWCDYLHVSHLKMNIEGNDAENDDRETTMNVDCFDDDIDTNDDKPKEECGSCQSNDAKNECDKCRKYFCRKCEHKVSGEESESVMEFFKSRNFVNYTCNTAHF